MRTTFILWLSVCGKVWNTYLLILLDPTSVSTLPRDFVLSVVNHMTNNQLSILPVVDISMLNRELIGTNYC